MDTPRHGNRRGSSPVLAEEGRIEVDEPENTIEPEDTIEPATEPEAEQEESKEKKEEEKKADESA